MVAFIDACREDFGVEPICAQLPIAPSSYYDAKSRPVSARARRHAAMTAVLVALWAANYRVYGARKLWLAARRAGHEIGRDQVAALMRAAGICGVTRRRRARTTVRDPGAERPGDLVNRDFTARSPNRLWVTDLTVAPTRTGAAYVCFIVDAFSRLIVGWRVAAHMRTEMVLDAVEMARRGRGARIEGLTVHSDAGSQFTSIRYTERLAELGAAPSVGSVGDSYDNALAETVIGLYKRELIRGPRQGPWDSAADVELATLGMGALAQPPAAAHLSGRRPARRVRGGLHCPTTRPANGWKPINRPSRNSRAVHFARSAAVWRAGRCCGRGGRGTRARPARRCGAPSRRACRSRGR